MITHSLFVLYYSCTSFFCILQLKVGARLETLGKKGITTKYLGQIQTHVTVSWFVFEPSEPAGHHNLFPHTVPPEIKKRCHGPNRALTESTDSEILFNASLMIF